MKKPDDQNYYRLRESATRAQAERCEDQQAKAIYLELAGLYQQAAHSAKVAAPAE